jgi:two-component system nitrogen regulation response regulator NtrX
MSAHILIVDDEADIRKLIQGILEDEGYRVSSCETSAQAYAMIESDAPSLIIQDIWLRGSEHDGLEILQNVQQNYPHLPVLMISGHGTIETAVAAIKDGAYDFIEKPFKSDRLLLMIQRALENASLKRENETLKQQAQIQGQASELLGDSTAIDKLRQIIERAAPTNSRVLLTGEAGTGKNVVAQMIHSMSERADAPYLLVNCASLDPDHLEEKLFGGGQAQGLLEQAHGGTLVLDEVYDMSLETQAKIVRVLQEQRFQKSDGEDFVDVDVRIIATSNRDLDQAISEGRFREDLYYRLNVVPIHVPALRERGADITALARRFLKIRQMGHDGACFTDGAFKKLRAYGWPGNVRQLRNVVEWVSIMHGLNDGAPYDVQHLPPEIVGAISGVQGQDHGALCPIIQDEFLDVPLREAREAFEREYLLSQIEKFDGNISKTAQFVGMERSALHRKIKALGVHEDQQDGDEAVKNSKKRA